MKNNPICVMGLGTVGFPTALYLHHRGCQVTGYDISSSAIQKASAYIKATDDPAEVPADTQYFIICVSTTQVNGRPDMSSVYDSCWKISEFHPRLVSIESTVPLGTCREIYESILKSRTSVAHVPHRYWSQDPYRHGVCQPRVLGGVDSISLLKAKQFYSRVRIPFLEVEPIEIAEMAKIAENSYRYVQIAFAQELQSICREKKIDFGKLRQACNSKWNIDIPEARDGIGGTCLPKDIRYLITAAEDLGLKPDLLRSAIQSDRTYRSGFLKPLVHA